MIIQCFPYLYTKPEKINLVILPGINIDDTLVIAEQELKEGGFDSVLTIWCMRDQLISNKQAEKISSLYFQYIESVDSEKPYRLFTVWHFTWAISNLYRRGNTQVKDVLLNAYNDAAERVKQLNFNIAKEHFSGKRIYSGDAHAGGRTYAKTHLIVPGKKGYLQSLKEYKEKKKKNLIF